MNIKQKDYLGVSMKGSKILPFVFIGLMSIIGIILILVSCSDRMCRGNCKVIYATGIGYDYIGCDSVMYGCGSDCAAAVAARKGNIGPFSPRCDCY